MTKINRNFGKRRFCILFFAVLAALSVSWPASGAGVSRGEIDQIRKLSVLQDSHLDKLEQFINEQFELMKAVQYDDSDTSNPAQTLSEISQSNVRRNEQLQWIYSDKFASVVQAATKNLFIYVEGLSDKKVAGQLKLQGAVVLANVDNILVLDDLLLLAEDKAEEIRYWAVKGLAMPRIQEYLRASGTDNESGRQKLMTALEKILEAETDPLVIGQIAFAALPESSGGQLLVKCVSKRVSQYKSWQVDHELVDLDILGTILMTIDSGQLSDSQQAQTDLMRSAVELYTAAFLRYVKGMRHEVSANKVIVLLPAKSRYDLLTLLVEGERGFIRISGSNRRARFVTDAKKRKWTALYNSFGRLLGPKGDIQQVFPVYPATMAEGEYLVEISEAPKELVEAAIVREQLGEKDAVITYP